MCELKRRRGLEREIARAFVAHCLSEKRLSSCFAGMAYQKADGAYRRRGSEHHRRFVPNPTVSNFSGYEPASSVEGSFSYPCQDRLAERHFSDPHALSTASYSTAASSGSQPLLVGRETFQEHEGASWNDRFFQEPRILKSRH